MTVIFALPGEPHLFILMASLQSFNRTSTVMTESEKMLNSGQLLAITLLIPAARFLYLDYCRYLALGPGGTPPTIAGYFRVKLLGLFALRNPYEPPKVPMYISQKKGCLSSLPLREGRRPSTLGIAPHRQTSQTSPPGKTCSAADIVGTHNSPVSRSICQVLCRNPKDSA